jgi:putative intracellular protease/amidase
MLLMFADSGQGVAIMANSENGITVGDILIENIAREYGWKEYVPPDRQRFGAATVLRAVARSRGTPAAMSAYHELKKSRSPAFVPDRQTLISLAYLLHGEGRAADALEVAKLEAKEFPDYWNAFDTLGEMAMHTGNRQQAMQSYEKALALNPDNENGRQILNTLRAAADAGGAAPPAGKKVYVCPPCGLECDKRVFDKPGVCPECGMALVEQTDRKPITKPITVAILLFNGVEIIDYSGPWEVFGQAGFIVHTVAEKAAPIRTAFGQRVLPDYTFENSPKADIVLIPGGNVSDALLANQRVIQWIQASAKDARYVMSVCTGAFLLAKAGLLEGQTATTFHPAIDRLARFAPGTKVVLDQRFVDNGKVLTTAGLSSGMDGALHLVAKLKGKGATQATALGLEYNWDASSKYARAAFADRFLPRFTGLGATLLATEGDRDHWQIRVLFSDSKSPAEVMETLSKLVVSGTRHAASPVTMRRPQTKSSTDRAEIEWQFADDEGRRWRGVGVAELSKDEKGQTVVTLTLARE